MVVCFISGHVDVDADFFKKHYVDRIAEAITLGHDFVVGDSVGIDALSIEYVQHNGGNIRVVSIKDFRSFNARDKYLTEISDYDIAYVRSEYEQKQLYGEKYIKRESATERNLKRRQKKIYKPNFLFNSVSTPT